jgi:hypothetical protein
MSDAVISQTLYPCLCRRCRSEFRSKYRGVKICPDCQRWLKETKFTHCHNRLCDDPENPAKFDRVKDTKYGKEYHCPKCNSWINFGLLADVFSVKKDK